MTATTVVICCLFVRKDLALIKINETDTIYMNNIRWAI